MDREASRATPTAAERAAYLQAGRSNPASDVDRVGIRDEATAVAEVTVAYGPALTKPQSTEFAIKVAILSSLTVTCAVVAIHQRVTEGKMAQPENRLVQRSARRLVPVGRLATLVTNPVLVAVMIVGVAAPINTLRLRGDKQIILIERGLAGPNAQ